MKIMKIPVIASSTLVDNKFFYLNVEDVFEIEGAVSVADAAIIRFTGGVSDSVITFTFDGTNAAEKVLNAKKFADYMAEKIQELTGPSSTQKKPFDLIPTLAEIHTATGIKLTGGTGNDAIKTIALT